MSAATAGTPIVHFVGGIPIAGRRDSVPYPGASNRTPITYHAEACCYAVATRWCMDIPPVVGLSAFARYVCGVAQSRAWMDGEAAGRTVG
jgi:hypothetical protein